jgi:polar amino acid transport system permease protein
MIETASTLWEAFAQATWITLSLTLVTLAIAIPATLAVAVALKENYRLATAYVDVSMKLPLVVNLFAFFYILQADPYTCSVAALVLHQVAFAAEVLRGGFNSVPAEIEDAALVTGLGRWCRLWSIRLPFALRQVAPSLLLQTVEVVKNTSIVSLIGLVEITAAAETYQSTTYRYAEGFAAAAVAYSLLVLPLMLVGRMFEHRLARGDA